jgi:ferredoxin
MEVVEEGLEQCGVDPGQLFVERFELFPGEAFAETEASATESIEIRLRGRTHHARYERGDTILDAARRAALKPPFSCTAGSCGTCMAFVANGEVAMRVNNVLDPDEVEQGWVLTCQAIPRSREVAIDYDR